MYSLTLDEQSAGLLMRALDLYARIGIGQLETLYDHPAVRQERLGKPFSFSMNALLLIGLLKDDLFGLSPPAARSIVADDVVPDAKQAYDIMSVIRHRLAWDKAGNPPERDRNMTTIEFDAPSHVCENRPLPVFEENIV
jgi:hypothetical protein